HTRWVRDWSSDVCSSDLVTRSSLQSMRIECMANLHEPPGKARVTTGETDLDAPAIHGAIRAEGEAVSAAHRRGGSAGVGAHRYDLIQGGRLEDLRHQPLRTA